MYYKIVSSKMNFNQIQLHYIIGHYTIVPYQLQLQLQMRYIQYTALHYATPVRYNTQHYTTLHDTMLHFTALRYRVPRLQLQLQLSSYSCSYTNYITPHYTTHNNITVRYSTLQLWLHVKQDLQMQLPLHHATTRYAPLHNLHYTMLTSHCKSGSNYTNYTTPQLQLH